MYQLSEIDTFKISYSSLVKSLESLKNSIDQHEKDYPEYYNWIKNMFYFLKYNVEGMKDIASWNFETQNFEKAKPFLSAYTKNIPTKNVPERFQDIMKEGIQEYSYAFEAFEGIEKIRKAEANMIMGNYHEAATNYEEAINTILENMEKGDEIMPGGTVK